MPDASNLPALADISKTLFEYIKIVNSSEVVNFVGTAMGINGYSLRDFVGKIQISNLIDKIKNHFKEKEKITEKQEKILRDCFLELEDYIKTCEELDENVFENISDVLINGIDNEDILTREYIKILKKLSWIDLLVLMDMNSVKEITTVDRIKYIEEMHQEYFTIFTNKHKDIPYELVQKSLGKIEEIGFINKIGVSYKETLSNLTTVNKIHLRSTLGDKIVNLIRGNNK